MPFGGSACSATNVSQWAISAVTKVRTVRANNPNTHRNCGLGVSRYAVRCSLVLKVVSMPETLFCELTRSDAGGMRSALPNQRAFKNLLPAVGLVINVLVC